MFFAGENLWAKSEQKLFRQVWGNSGKNPSHPQEFAYSYLLVKVQGSLQCLGKDALTKRCF